MATPWKPDEKPGEPTRDRVFAFPDQRKEPPTIADADRARAFDTIRSAARFFGVDMQESDWRRLGRRPRAGRAAGERKEPARKRNERQPPET